MVSLMVRGLRSYDKHTKGIICAVLCGRDKLL